MYNDFTYPLPKNPHTEKLLENVRAQAEEMYDDDITSLPYTKFVLFHKNGNRTEYEIPYMLHRKMLCVYCAMVLTGENNEKWLPKLCDVVWAVCDEYTWALPAHLEFAHLGTDFTVEQTVTKIDLFAAETANALSEIYYMLENILPFEVKSRIVYELNRRIIKPYMEKPCKWGKNNWSAVCAYGVASTFVYLGLHDEFDKIKDSIFASIDVFLSSYNDDGCCLEGSLYWSYGYGFFVYFANLMYDYSQGKINYFADEKVKKIAQFGTDSYLYENCVIPFSDSPHTMKYDSGLWSILAEKFDGICIPDEKYQNLLGDDIRYRFTPFMRNLYWGGKYKSEKETSDKTKYYENAQWYIKKQGDVTFCAKGGTNDEPHNHNDVGSFVFLDKDSFILDDVGWQEYTKDYFDAKKRYTEIMCTSSEGHSVPIVDGNLQKFGKECRAKVICSSENTFEIEYSSAYNLENLQNLTRKFTLSKDNCLVIEDSAKGELASFNDRFVTRIKPEIVGDAVKIGSYCLACDKKAKISLSYFDFEPRFTGFDGETVTERAYIIDFGFENFEECRFELK